MSNPSRSEELEILVLSLNHNYQPIFSLKIVFLKYCISEKKVLSNHLTGQFTRHKSSHILPAMQSTDDWRFLEAVITKWLRRSTWNPMVATRVGSNPARSQEKVIFAVSINHNYQRIYSIKTVFSLNTSHQKRESFYQITSPVRPIGLKIITL